MNAQNGQTFVPPPQPAQQPYAPAPTQQMPVAPQQPQQGYGQFPQQPVQQHQQPVQQQQQFAPPAPPPNQYPTFPNIAPNPNVTPGPQFAAPQQTVQQQPAQSPFLDQMYASLATNLGTTPEILRNQIGDDPARVAAVIAAAARRAREPQQPAPAPAPAPAQPQNTVANEVPPQAFQYMKQNEATGLWEPLVQQPQVQQWAYLQNQKDWEAKQFISDFTKDPASIMKHPKFEGVIKQQVQQLVAEQTAARELERVRTSYRDKFAPVILEHDQQGQPARDFQGNMVFTPAGRTFNEIAKRLYERGMEESDELYETAMALTEKKHGIAGQQQQQQFQQPQQPFQPLGFNGQYPAPQQFQPQQPQLTGQWSGGNQQQPVVHQILRRNMNGNSYQQGIGAPARPPQPIRGLPLRDAMQVALQGANPDLGMEQYWNMLFPKQ